MKIIEGVEEMARTSRSLKSEGKKIAFVPTMGYLHEGHLSLIGEGRRRGDILVVSIFVNPTQFGEGEDFHRYPRDVRRDIGILEDENVDILFLPGADEMYPEGFQTHVEVERLSRGLCGISRPGHFRGVATVVAKLFNIVSPDVAVFGKKDYQQLAVIRRMARDLNFHLEIIGMPVVREPDGLAMSSRNAYLSGEDRQKALSLYRALSKAERLFSDGVRDAGRIIGAAAREMEGNVEVEYIEIRDTQTLDPVDTIKGEALLAVAARVGDTRLIDNTVLKEEKS